MGAKWRKQENCNAPCLITHHSMQRQTQRRGIKKKHANNDNTIETNGQWKKIEKAEWSTCVACADSDGEEKKEMERKPRASSQPLLMCKLAETIIKL